MFGGRAKLAWTPVETHDASDKQLKIECHSLGKCDNLLKTNANNNNG